MEICIIDDDEIHHFIMKKLLSEVLENQNYPVIFLYNGEEGFKYLKNEDISQKKYLIFLDIDMPIMDGWDFLDAYIEYFKESPDTIHIYIFSSSRDPHDLKKVEEYPFVIDYILKPIDVNTLKEIVFKY